MNYSPRETILHPQKIQLATIRRRSAAFLLDWLLLVLLYLAIILLFSLFGMHISNVNIHGIFEVEVEMEETPAIVVTLLKWLFGLLPLFYFALSFHRFGGQTIGKHLLQLRVLSLYHKQIGWWHAIERSLGYFASALEFGLGFLQALWNPNRMTLHDKIGETIVVRLPRKVNRLVKHPAKVNSPAEARIVRKTNHKRKDG